tara:strand:- start:130 stop:270 length:141 start_codon:yes stop_codon:yes gene_type:complete
MPNYLTQQTELQQTLKKKDPNDKKEKQLKTKDLFDTTKVKPKKVKR